MDRNKIIGGTFGVVTSDALGLPVQSYPLRWGEAHDANARRDQKMSYPLRWGEASAMMVH